MSEKSWKRTERKVAQLLGGERVSVNGRIQRFRVALDQLEYGDMGKD